MTLYLKSLVSKSNGMSNMIDGRYLNEKILVMPLFSYEKKVCEKKGNSTSGSAAISQELISDSTK